MSMFLAISAYLLRSAYGQSYCISGVGPLNSNDGNLGPVSLQGISKSISDSQNCPGQVGVIDQTSTQEADVGIGGSYTLRMEITSCSTLSDPIAGNAWIDWNQNGAFEDDERLPQGNMVGYSSHDITFTVPQSALLGTTRMRVQAQETTQTSILLDPCLNFRWGGSKDYSITVASSSATNIRDGLSRGSKILVAMFLISFFYITIGCGYNHSKGGEGFRGHFPQYDFWFVRLPILVKAGIGFTRAKIMGGSTGFKDMDDDDLL